MTDDLDRVLEGLGKVEAPAGLERRVLRAMAAPVRGRSVVWGWVGVATLILAGVLAGTLERGKSKAVGFANTPPFHEAESVGHTRPESVMVGKGRTVVVSRQRRDSSTAAIAKGALDSAQNEELPVVAEERGFPAPEEPLSEQEKLLLKLARRPSPKLMAVFDVKLNEQHAAMAKAEFDEFFKPVVVATQPDQDLQVANPTGIEEKKDETLAGKQ